MLVVSFDHYLQFSYSSICYTNWVFANAFADLSAKWFGHVLPTPSLCFVLTCVISFQRLSENTEGTKGTADSSLLVVLMMMKWKPKTKAFPIMCLEGRRGTIRETT